MPPGKATVAVSTITSSDGGHRRLLAQSTDATAGNADKLLQWIRTRCRRETPMRKGPRADG